MPLTLGIDPGGSQTGYVVRNGRTLVDWDLLDRDQADRTLWVEACVEAANNLALEFEPELVAVENLNDPTPHMGVTSVRGLIDTAVIIGALVAWSQDFPLPLQLVPPACHGRAAEGLGRAALVAAYPGLVGPREKSGAGQMRHVRAAWDIAGHANKSQLRLVEGA